jgi:dCMP deaminase
MKWDKRFLELAKFIAQWSKDPSTKTGAVIVSPDRRIISCGYNGFAQGVDDDKDRYNNRELKYKMIVHCERNALLFANRPLKGCTLYTWPFASCSVCAAMVIQSGITRCVAPPLPSELEVRWGADLELTRIMFIEAKVKLDSISLEEPNISLENGVNNDLQSTNHFGTEALGKGKAA